MHDVLTKAIGELYTTNLGVKKQERLLVLTDRVSSVEEMTEEERRRRESLSVVAKKVAEAGKGICGRIAFLSYPSLKGHGKEPPEEAWRSAFGDRTVEELKAAGLLAKIINKEEFSKKEVDEIETIVRSHKTDAVHAIIALTNFSTSHTKFRDLITTLCGCRYASMPLFEEEMFYGPMQVDWNLLSKRTSGIAAQMENGDRVILTSRNGTDLSLGIKGRRIWADTGILTTPGSFGNLPAGEVFLAPVEGTTEGRLVLEWAPTAKLASPVTVEIEKGLVKKVTGKDPYAQRLETKLNENTDFRNVAELGIGTNDKAKRPDNILESEKILGTIHIAFGDNSTFGGIVRTPFHQDFVLFHPTVKVVKGKRETVILKDGDLVSKNSD